MKLPRFLKWQWTDGEYDEPTGVTFKTPRWWVQLKRKRYDRKYAKRRAEMHDNVKVIDMGKTITLLEPDCTGFEALMSMMASKTQPQTKIQWLEDELMPRGTARFGDVTLVNIDWEFPSAPYVAPVGQKIQKVISNGKVVRVA